MEAKRYTNAPSKEWWLVAMVVYHFLQTVNVTFDALQVDSGIVSKQYDNLRKLLEQLRECGKASVGQFMTILINKSLLFSPLGPPRKGSILAYYCVLL